MVFKKSENFMKTEKKIFFSSVGYICVLINTASSGNPDYFLLNLFQLQSQLVFHRFCSVGNARMKVNLKTIVLKLF